MVDLPLGATEDRVCGTIDIEKALTGTCSINLTAPWYSFLLLEGTKAFEPGLLAKVSANSLVSFQTDTCS